MRKDRERETGKIDDDVLRDVRHQNLERVRQYFIAPPILGSAFSTYDVLLSPIGIYTVKSIPWTKVKPGKSVIWLYSKIPL